MKIIRPFLASGFSGVIFIFGLAVSSPIFGAILYKNYLVQKDRGIDILCEPYTVQKKDWIYKIFRQKGEISYRDFPEFLQIFKRLNPCIQDIDLIRPNQKILIPLKKFATQELPGQSTGVVTIPFVTIFKIKELIKEHSVEYKVKKGDCVSKIISQRFGAYGSRSYNEGIKLFKRLNPSINNIDIIYFGETINVPDPSVKKQPWYRSLFDSSGSIIDDKQTVNARPPEIKPSEPIVKEDTNRSSLLEVASILDAKLINKGIYHFPRDDNEDLRLNLSRFPVIELKSGARILCVKDENISDDAKKTIKSHWPILKIVSVSPKDAPEKILSSIFDTQQGAKDDIENILTLSDQGVGVTIHANWIIDKPAEQKEAACKVCIFLIDNNSEKTSDSISHYLALHNIIVKDILNKNISSSAKLPDADSFEANENTVFISFSDKKSFVKDFLSEIGYNYFSNIQITFPYAGIQVEAISNLVPTQTGMPLLVDFGDLYGDAVSAIERAGFEVVQIKKGDDYNNIAQKLLSVLDFVYIPNPTFFAAKRPASKNISISLAGLLITNNNRKRLITDISFHDDIVRFLKEKGVQVIIVRGK